MERWMLAATIAGLGLLAAAPAAAQAVSGAAPPAVFRIERVAERNVATLPDGPLFWRVTSASGPAVAPTGDALTLVAEADGRAWTFTLGPRGADGAGVEAEIGPVPTPEAGAGYVLRVNRARATSGAKTEVHSHPGSEAFLVRSGRLCQRTSQGDLELGAGESAAGHAPGAVMQLTSCGEGELDQWVMFVLDASQPFSSPASFDAAD